MAACSNRYRLSLLSSAMAPLLVRAAKSLKASKAAAGEQVVDLYDAWTKEQLAKREKRQDTINQDRKVLAQFASFVGENNVFRGKVKAVSDGQAVVASGRG